MVLRVNKAQKEERERIARSLLRATLHLAAAHGFSGLGLREVARAAGIAPTSFYRHFQDMEALGLSIIEDLGRELAKNCHDRAKESQSASNATAVLALAWMAEAEADPELMRFLLAERVGALRPFRDAIEQSLTEFTAALRSAVGADLGIADEIVPDHLVGAIRTLILDACADLLHLGAEHRAEVSDRIRKQLQLIFKGAERSNKQ